MSFTNIPSLEDILNLEIPYKEDFFKEVDIKSKEENITLNWNGEKRVIKKVVLLEPYEKTPPIIQCYHDLYYELSDIYQSYMMNTLSLEIWYEFIKDFKDEIEEYYEDIMSVDYGSLILSIHKKEKPDNRVRVGWTQSIIRDKKYIDK